MQDLVHAVRRTHASAHPNRATGEPEQGIADDRVEGSPSAALSVSSDSERHPCCFLVSGASRQPLLATLCGTPWSSQLSRISAASSPSFQTLVLVRNDSAATALLQQLEQQLPPGLAAAGLPNLSRSNHTTACNLAVADVGSFRQWLQQLSKIGAESELPASQLPLWGLQWVIVFEESTTTTTAAAEEAFPTAATAAAAPTAATAPAAAAARPWPRQTFHTLRVLSRAVADEGLIQQSPSYIFLPQVGTCTTTSKWSRPKRS